MIKPPSLQNEYTFISADDPAITWPADDDERARAVATARDTGVYPVAEGQTPVTYRLRQIKGSTFDWFQGHCRREQLGELEAQALFLRLGLVEVDGLGKTSVGAPERMAGHVIAPESIVDALYEKVGRTVVAEIATHLLGRATAPLSPKSR